MSISKNKTKPKKAKKRRNPIHAYKKLLANDHDWDYAYLIALEKKKLQRMRDCIKQEHHLANNEFVVRDMGICIRLIDIFMDNDAVYNTWLDRSYSGTRLRFRKLEDGNYELVDEGRKPLADLPVYVNVRNERRYFRSTPIKDATADNKCEQSILLKISLRKQKALHLYHLIREYKLFDWWD